MEMPIDTLSEATRNWVANQLSRQAEKAEITKLERLQGGISSQIYSISLRRGNENIRVVLRQIHNEDWLSEQPDAAFQEASALQLCESASIAAPLRIACDAAGEQCGNPSLLMTQLPGAPLLMPSDMDSWLCQLADALAHIHQIQARSPYWTYRTYQTIDQFVAPSWSKQQLQWNTLLSRLKQPPPSTLNCFIHRDFHPANVLWHEGKVTGIVDWTSGCVGPAGIDAGHCRINLVMLHGVAAADRFLQYYIEANQSFIYDPYWDILSLIDMLFGPPTVYQGWVALGVTHLTDEMMVERIEEYTASLADKLGS